VRFLPFGVSIAAIISHAARMGASRSNVLWQVPQLEEMPVFHRGRRHKVKTGRAFGYNHGIIYGTNGEREMARRLRQIQRGQLKAENGLVI
jgi:hypothetical protein